MFQRGGNLYIRTYDFLKSNVPMTGVAYSTELCRFTINSTISSQWYQGHQNWSSHAKFMTSWRKNCIKMIAFYTYSKHCFICFKISELKPCFLSRSYNLVLQPLVIFQYWGKHDFLYWEFYTINDDALTHKIEINTPFLVSSTYT